jgi:polysaccharide biosynthesis/export protein
MLGRSVAAVVVILLACFCLTGCATKVYRAKSLPAEWHARPTSNVKTVGLAQFATDTVPYDQIAKGDVLAVSIAAGLAATDAVEVSARVGDNGTILLPHIGPVEVEGLMLEEAESAITVACIERQIYRAPQVTVTMKQRRTIQVTVVGGVEQQGTYIIPAGSAGLLYAISKAGGFSEDAGTIVDIRLPERPSGAPRDEGGLIAQTGGTGTTADGPADGETALAGHEVHGLDFAPGRIRFDLASMADIDPSQLQLLDGSVIDIERRDPLPIQVLGLVRKPDVYEFPVGKDLHLLDAISMAGGEASPVANKVFVIRRRPDQPEPILIELSMRAAKRNGRENILLEPGDTISVEQTPATVMLEAIRSIGVNIGGAVF